MFQDIIRLLFDLSVLRVKVPRISEFVAGHRHRMIDILMMIFYRRLAPNSPISIRPETCPVSVFVLLLNGLNADRWVALILSDDECLNQPGGKSADVCTALQ